MNSKFLDAKKSTYDRAKDVYYHLYSTLLGLVPREKSAIERLTLKSLPDPDTMEKSKIQKKTLDPIWEETFELLVFEQPRVLVMEVWDDDIAQQTEGRSSIKGWRGLKFKIIDFFKPGQDDFLGKNQFKFLQISCLLHHYSKFISIIVNHIFAISKHSFHKR